MEKMCIIVSSEELFVFGKRTDHLIVRAKVSDVNRCEAEETTGTESVSRWAKSNFSRRRKQNQGIYSTDGTRRSKGLAKETDSLRIAQDSKGTEPLSPFQRDAPNVRRSPSTSTTHERFTDTLN